MHIASTGTDPLRPQTKKALAQKGRKPERRLTKKATNQRGTWPKKGHTPKMSHTRRKCLQNVYLYGGFVFFMLFKV